MTMRRRGDDCWVAGGMECSISDGRVASSRIHQKYAISVMPSQITTALDTSAGKVQVHCIRDTTTCVYLNNQESGTRDLHSVSAVRSSLGLSLEKLRSSAAIDSLTVNSAGLPWDSQALPSGGSQWREDSITDVCSLCLAGPAHNHNIDSIQRHAVLAAGAAIPVTAVHMMDADRFGHGRDACRSTELSELAFRSAFTCPTWLTDPAAGDMTHKWREKSVSRYRDACD